MGTPEKLEFWWSDEGWNYYRDDSINYCLLEDGKIVMYLICCQPGHGAEILWPDKKLLGSGVYHHSEPIGCLKPSSLKE